MLIVVEGPGQTGGMLGGTGAPPAMAQVVAPGGGGAEEGMQILFQSFAGC